jgi:hypothetical protein
MKCSVSAFEILLGIQTNGDPLLIPCVTSHMFRGAREVFSQRLYSFLLLIIIPPFLYLSQLAGVWDIPEQTEHHTIRPLIKGFISVTVIRWLQNKEVKFQPNKTSTWPVRHSMMQRPIIQSEGDTYTCCERRNQLFAVAATCVFYESAWEIRTFLSCCAVVNIFQLKAALGRKETK